MNNLLDKFLVILVGICMIFPQIRIVEVAATERNGISYSSKIDETIYEKPKFLNSARSSSVSQFTYNNDGNLTYAVIKSAASNYRGEVEVRGNNSSMTSISIPSTVYDNDGYTYDVTAIASRGFYDYRKLKSVTIPKTVDTIKEGAFLDCVELRTITIYSNRLYLYNRAFSNIASDPTFYVSNSSVEDELLDHVDNDADIIVDDYDDDNDDSKDGYYKVTLKSEKGGKVSGGGTYEKRDTVTIRATPNDDYEFDRWVVDVGDASLDDRYNEKTSFKMPSEKVTITAQFNYIGDDYYYYDKNYPNSSTNNNQSIQNNATIRNNLASTTLDKFFTEDNISAKIEDVVVNLGSNSNTATSQFENVKGTNGNIIFTLSGYKWIINGKDIATNITDKGYCNLGVNFKQTIDSNLSALSQSTSVSQFNLLYEGDLPFKGILEFSPKDILGKQPIYMYKYNPSTNTIKYQDYDIVDENGIVQLNIDESATYMLTDQIIKDTYVVQKTNVNNVSLDTIIPYYDNNGEQGLVTISGRDGNNIVFVAPETTKYDFVNNAKIFDDTQNHWAKSSIDYVSARELFNGVSENEFAPNSTITRGMFITALGNFDNVDTIWYSGGNDTVYYAPYVDWANDNGILNNIDSTNFDSSITREEMAVILQNYSNYINFNIPQGNDTTIFTDDEQISPSAKSAISSMNKLGIINGKDKNNFNPKDEATRAEASVMFRRYIESILHNQIKIINNN